MTWWKFWTWRRHDNLHGDDQTHRDVRSHRTTVQDPEDLLMSIPGLIDNQHDDLVDFVRTTRTVELAPLADNESNSEAIAIVNRPPTALGIESTEASGTAALNSVNATPAPLEPVLAVASTIPAAAATRLPERTAASSFEPPKPQKKLRESGSLNRDVARKDPRKTLVAEDGQWPAFKGLSETFKDLDDDESDDLDGSSPFQTIVPNDD